ncbi:hypothetical protein, partial [uncultured Formosa sp.]|uniref:hypothetical protein n=1 Tax=uncultured Formosa sp. TaxID=255435 RepID=UPI00260A3396
KTVVGNKKNEMEFEPEYISGIGKVLILTLLISFLPNYFLENENPYLLFGISIILFLIILNLKNKKWIKRVKIDSKRAEFRIEYPMNLIGNKKMNLSFSEIEKATYYEYMSRTPAHYKIEFNGGKLRFNCSGNESEKISSILKTNGIETNFYHQEKEVGYR